MNFVERVRNILLKKNKNELSSIDKKISELESLLYEHSKDLSTLQESSKNISQEKSDIQKRILSKKDLKKLETIYDFVSYFPTIEKVTKTIVKNVGLLDHLKIDVIGSDTMAPDEELEYRERLCVILQNINEEVSKILNEETDKSNSSESTVISEKQEQPKEKGILSRFFNKFKNELDEAKPSVNNKKLSFLEYRKNVALYKTYYNSFICVNLDGFPTIVDRQLASIIALNVKNMLKAQDKGYELNEDDTLYLDSVYPLELWKEISRYYSNLSSITAIIDSFDLSIDEFENLYMSNPELFDINNLEQIFQENDLLLIDLKQKTKQINVATNKKSKKQSENLDIRKQLQELKHKKSNLLKQQKDITDAATLQKLGFKSKSDAVQKLSLDVSDYIVLPIDNSINKISDLFFEEKSLKIQFDENTFTSSYINECATGRINHLDDAHSSFTSALLVPISSLAESDIDSVRGGKVVLNSTVLNKKDLVLVAPKNHNINLENLNIETNLYENGSLLKNLENFLGDDYTSNPDETSHYNIFKSVPNISHREKSLRRIAVRNCIFENSRKTDNLYHTNILVNGKLFFLNRDDDIYIKTTPSTQALNEKKLYNIADQIEDFILEDSTHKISIDSLYQKLLFEYLRVNQKAKADYYDESNSTVLLKDKKMSIKPFLPDTNEKIAKKYSRPNEDVVYKAIKLSALVNKFAHLSENEELQNKLFNIKLDLIEYAIDLSANNPSIKLKKKFDESKMLMSVVLEIPGYNTIALHVKNKSDSLSYKTHRLDDTDLDIPQSSTILMPGVNKNLLATLKKMDINERNKFLASLPPEVFYKLVLRMGYTSENFSTESKRKKFIEQITSDKNIDALINNENDQEK